jgi:hypothetical protein
LTGSDPVESADPGEVTDQRLARGSRVLATAEDVLTAAAVPASFLDETLARLAKSQLSESLQQLIFNYRLAVEAMES